MHHKTLLFDLDGTLTDPYEGITRCVRYALARQGIDVSDRRRLAGYIGPPLKAAFMEFHGLTDTAADRAIDDYHERFARVGMFENAVYEGIAALLSELHASGRQLFVATSKPGFFARQIVAYFGLDTYFDDIYGSELDGTRTDKSALIAHLLCEQSLRPNETLMIGDRRFDVLGARHNNVACAAVSYGYGTREELTAAAPDYFFESPDAIRRGLLGDAMRTEPDRQYGSVLR